jgi:Carboxypeptidase regulatory-like domain
MRKNSLLVSSSILPWILSGVLCRYSVACPGLTDPQAASDSSFTLPDSPGVLLSQSKQTAPEQQRGSIVGTVTDVHGYSIPGARVTVTGPAAGDDQAVTADGNGFFTLGNLSSAVPLQVTVKATGFSDWTSPAIALSPGQYLLLTGIKLSLPPVVTTVNAVTIEQLAVEQVQIEEKQRVLGILPNFYVVYDSKAVPLTPKLKFQLAFKTWTDAVTLAATAGLAGINQAADTPDYVEGMKGYGQRFGAAYANGFSDIMIGGAILPSLLHQDPRYFYQGTGTKKSRALHAIRSPLICKGDNGKWQFNASSIGGDLAAGAIQNLYYPMSNRGPGLVFTGFAIDTGARIGLALAEEFLLHKVTNTGKKQN